MADVTLIAGLPRVPSARGRVWRLAACVRGNWTAHLEFADQVAAPAGKVTLRWQGRDEAGAVLRSGQTSAGRTFALVAGGNGHPAQAIPPKIKEQSYRNATAQVIASQLLTAAGDS